MRKLVCDKITNNWNRGIGDMLNVCYTMGWQEEILPNGREITYATNAKGPCRWYLEDSKVSFDLLACLASCSDEALLVWLEAQHCEIYR
jgi:hypothetical protein